MSLPFAWTIPPMKEQVFCEPSFMRKTQQTLHMQKNPFKTNSHQNFTCNSSWMEGLATGARTEVFLSATLFCRSCCWTIARRHPLLPDIFLIDVALVWIMIESLNPLINWLIWIVGKWILCCLLSTTAAEFVKLSLASRQQPHYISTAGKLATCKYLLLRNWCRESHVCT